MLVKEFDVKTIIRGRGGRLFFSLSEAAVRFSSNTINFIFYKSFYFLYVKQKGAFRGI